LPNRLIVGFCNVISTIVVIVGYCAEIVIEILVVDRLSPSPGAGRKRRKRSVVRSCRDLKRGRVISTKN
jgi:hypothetical protein